MGLIGQSLTRREDERLVTGHGNYVTDQVAPGMVHMALLRSPHAHAKIEALDLEEARKLPGVVGVFGPGDIAAIQKPMPMAPGPGLRVAAPCPLADGVVRHVGEAVAVVVAESRYIAEDAVDKIDVRYAPLPVVVDMEKADEGGVFLHEGWDTNTAATVGQKVGEGKAALKKADVVVSLTLRLGRVVVNPMEPRGVLARYDAPSGRLHVTAGTQGAHSLKAGLAKALSMEPDKVRVVAPDVGGGFGAKNRLYQEDLLASFLAMRLGRPVKWAGDRREEFLSTNQERDQVHHAQIGVDRQGHIVAVTDHFIQDNGAYTVSSLIVPSSTVLSVAGPYKVPNLEVTGEVVLTNKVPIGPYRGAGRPQGTFVMERLLDKAADQLGISRVEIRRQNLIRPEDLPYKTGLQSRVGEVVHREGNFPESMETVLAALNLDGLSERKAKARKEGRLLGVAVANYLEISAGNAFEGARMTLQRDGTVTVASGASSQGQGHETSLSQVVADRLDLPIDGVRMVEGDTDSIGRGVGTFGSRTMVMAGNAVRLAAPEFQKKVLAAAGALMEADPADLVWEQGAVSVRGVPGRKLTLQDIAERSPEPIWAEAFYDATDSAFGMGTHGVVISLDAETLQLRFEKYVICHDGGVVINPLLTRGQVVGGTVQGLGTAILEEFVVDEQGQPQNASFMDYLLPAAGEMPAFEIIERNFPSQGNPEGFKGVGEGGIMPPMAAVLAAMEDALGTQEIFLDTLPVTPGRLHRLLAQAKGGSH